MSAPYNKEEIILETLSFFEMMTKENIIMDMNVHETDELQITLEDLELILESLKKRKLIRKGKKEQDIAWQKIFPKKSLWRKIQSFF